MVFYANVKQVRDYTNIQTAEFTDDQITLMLQGATGEIDSRTGRTWQGVATANNELYDGDGSKTLHLKQIDIQSVTYLGIDDDDDDVYDEISSNWYDVYNAGYIKLTASASPGTFTQGNQTVKVTYTYGNATPTDDVRHLCLEMVAEMMEPDTTGGRKERIERKLKELKQIGATMINVGAKGSY